MSSRSNTTHSGVYSKCEMLDSETNTPMFNRNNNRNGQLHSVEEKLIYSSNF